jgi:adenylate cyclase class IV
VSATEQELKAVVADPAAVAARLEAVGAARAFRGRMTDRRYDRPDGSLFSRDEVLRLRTFEPRGAGDAGAELTWKGPTRRRGGYKEREELQLGVGDAAAAAEVLGRLGYVVIDAIDRGVEYYRLDDVTLRLEWYPRMDVLIEVEGAPEAIERGVAATGLPRSAFCADRLVDFAGRYAERTGRAAAVALAALEAGERAGWPEWAR